MIIGTRLVHLRKDNPWTAITYAQDFCDEGAGLGAQSILRLQAIASARDEGYNLRAVVLAGGLRPKISEYPKQTKPLAEMMGDWLVTEGKFPPDLVHRSTNNKAWNCIEATLEMIHMIKTQSLPQNVLVISTGFHIFPRMWATWVLLCGGKKDWQLGFLPAWHGTYGVLHELGGTVKYIPIALWYRGKI